MSAILSTTELMRRKRGASRLALGSNSLLLAIKLVVGAITGSVAVLAEIVNSASDLAGSLIMYWSVRVSDEPPDQTHTYGHGKIENLSGIITATLILGGGVGAIVEAVSRIIHPGRLSGVNWAVGAMLVSGGVNAFISARLLKVGRETESPALAADGLHLRTDVLTSFGVAAGLGLVILTGNHMWDSIAGLSVSFLILRIGYKVARDAVETLVDHALPDEERGALEAVIRSHPSVRGYHRLRTRKSGSMRHADVHVLFDDESTLVEAHRLTEDLEDRLRDALPNLDAMVHPEPYLEETAHQRERHAEEERLFNNK